MCVLLNFMCVYVLLLYVKRYHQNSSILDILFDNNYIGFCSGEDPQKPLLSGEMPREISEKNIRIQTTRSD
jgi:hypothetical protein